LSSILIAGNTSGTITLDAPAVAGTTTLTLPTTSGTVLTSASSIPTSQLSGSISAASLPAGSILQVVSSTKTDTFSTTTTGSWIDVTGLSVSITPTSSSSRIMIFSRITGAGEAAVTRLQIRLVRDSTAISIGDASGSRLQVSGGELYYGGENDSLLNSSVSFLDSPATTSSTTYKLQIRNGNSNGTIVVNRTRNNNNDNATPVATSSITVMEIKG